MKNLLTENKGKMLLLLGTLVSILVFPIAMAHVAPPPGGTENHVDTAALPGDAAAALAAGYFVAEECLPGMGRHALRFVDEIPQDPVLMFAPGENGELLGIEFFTRFYPDDPTVLLESFGIDLADPATWPVPVPPWNGPMGPHPGMPPDTLHWDLHIYLADATNACNPVGRVTATGSVSAFLSGEAVSGATLTLTGITVDGTFTAFSEEDGTFAFSGVPAGHYQLTAEASGYKPRGRLVDATETIDFGPVRLFPGG